MKIRGIWLILAVAIGAGCTPSGSVCPAACKNHNTRSIEIRPGEAQVVFGYRSDEPPVIWILRVRPGGNLSENGHELSDHGIEKTFASLSGRRTGWAIDLRVVAPTD